MVVVRVTRVDAVVLRHRCGPCTDALESGEDPTRMRRDPDMHHRALAACTYTVRAIAVGIDHTDHPRLAIGPRAPTQIVVLVPGHQRSGELGKGRVVGRARAGDVHGTREGSLVAVDGVHERLRSGRVEEHVVVDEIAAHVVLGAGAGVTDRGVPRRDRGGGVRVLGKLAQGALDERHRTLFLFGRDSLDAGHVDRLRRIPRARPGRGDRLGDGGRVIVSIVVDRVALGCRGIALSGCLVIVRMCARLAGRHGCTFRARCGFFAVVVLGIRCVGAMSGPAGVGMGARGKHRGDGHDTDQCRGSHQTGLALAVGRKQGAGIGGQDGDQREGGGGHVGELRCLADFEAIDPGDAEEPCGEPPEREDGVDHHDSPRGRFRRSDERPQPDADLEHRRDDEDPSELSMLGVDAGRRCVDGTRGDRCETAERDDRHTSSFGRRLGIEVRGARPGAGIINRHHRSLRVV